MTRRLPVLLLLLALALPAAAEARSKTVKLRLPAEGDISFARYTVTTAKPDALRLPSARRLGNSIVVTGASVLPRNRYEVTVMLVNPQGGASGAQTTNFDVVFPSRGSAPITASKTGAAVNLLTQPVTEKESTAVGRLCDRPPPRRSRRRSRGFYQARGGSSGDRRRIRVLFTPEACQDQPPTETGAASRQLRELGVSVPGCTGSVARYGADPMEVNARMVCTQATNAFALRAPTGNEGRNCLGPQGSACAYGQFCAPMPRESVCYGDTDGFASDTLLEFRAQFAQPVVPGDIRGIWVPQGSPIVREQHAYLRYILDTP